MCLKGTLLFLYDTKSVVQVAQPQLILMVYLNANEKGYYI